MAKINAKRAEWAKAAVAKFLDACPNDPFHDQPEQVLSDLIADCLHLGNTLGLDAERIIARAAGHFYVELAEDQDEE